MNNKNTLILAAGGALLVGGIATAAFLAGGASKQADLAAASTGLAGTLDAVDPDTLPAGAQLTQADVVAVSPVRKQRQITATVTQSTPIVQTVNSTRDEQQCNDVVVQERAPERDGNVGGTVAGAVIGGLVGNQIGGGDGRKVATVAGAVAGGVIGNQVDKRHVGGRVSERVERQCQTIQVPVSEEKVVGYDVTYRTAEGIVATRRMETKPGQSIVLDADSEVVGYDVTYRLDGNEHQVRLPQRPQGDQLTLVDGQVPGAIQ
ncbi:hypothetical protein ABB25_08095 [Stenotrophomonas koreensis]|jgi:uncharacterized protein YcfJ|uniref:Glycine zipper 2TM domain-containing protein n=1 Tax=Stenotrophomonas koreensis TaxID=266128 RepID=A0A0R0BML9_9GAMM|nr:glycine zipper 2TM domain-containing protein [Stenotrophomonas koreensis]KRG58230.1 hypothetical protein ABB25_08095 [Stenotrophomonas koreensis]